MKLLSFLIFMFSLGLCFTGCKKEDPCEDVICRNGGICTDGSCDCQTGYIGTDCGTVDLTKSVQELLNAGLSPKVLNNAGILLDSLYGKLYEGGFIFYIDTIDWTGMVAATENQSEGAEWGCYGTQLPGAGAVSTGYGAQNTTEIVSACQESGIAARLCHDLVLNGKDDWFLPSTGELGRMYNNLKANGYGNFPSGCTWYWTSVQSGSIGTKAVYMYFGWGNAFAGDRDKEFCVRAARAF